MPKSCGIYCILIRKHLEKEGKFHRGTIIDFYVKGLKCSISANTKYKKLHQQVDAAYSFRKKKTVKIEFEFIGISSSMRTYKVLDFTEKYYNTVTCFVPLEFRINNRYIYEFFMLSSWGFRLFNTRYTSYT